MKKIIIVIGMLVVMGFMLFGCARAPWIIKSTPLMQTVNNDLYSIQLLPTAENRYSFTAFELTIENKTNNDIDVIWDRTYYLNEGKTSGGFMNEGIVYKDRNNPRSPDVVFPKIKFQKTIMPNILVYFSAGKIAWYHDQMPDGENGIYITLIVNGKEVREKLVVNLSAKYGPTPPNIFQRLMN